MTDEQEHKNRLDEARQGSSSGGSLQHKAKLAKEIADAVKSPQGKAKLVLSFGKKLTKHWMIMVAAVAFDVFALIPLLNFLFNAAFGFILYLYFGSEKKSGGAAGLMGIVLPIGLGSAFDIILNALPVCFGAAMIRIMMSQDEE
jgi:hypothetical protein